MTAMSDAHRVLTRAASLADRAGARAISAAARGDVMLSAGLVCHRLAADCQERELLCHRITPLNQILAGAT